MNTEEMLKRAEEAGKLYKDIEQEYRQPYTIIDSGNWYNLAYKQAELIAAMAEEVKKREEDIQYIGLNDTKGNKMKIGNIVHWTDGGDELSLEKRIASRWDRIAIIDRNPDITFTVIDSPNEYTKNNKHQFGYGNFIYKDTARYLTIVAENIEEYHAKFKNAGECMAYVLKLQAAPTPEEIK